MEKTKSFSPRRSLQNVAFDNMPHQNFIYKKKLFKTTNLKEKATHSVLFG